jgi:hypothetical protein
LRELGVQVLAKAAYGLRGSFQILSEGTIQAKVLMELEDSKGNVLYKREISFLEPEVVALLTPDPIKPDKNPLSRVYQEQNKFRTTRESPFQVEILVADESALPRDRKPIAEDYTAPECSLKDGYAFANLEEGQCYALRIHNQSDRDACFNLSVDGLNVFQLSKDQKPRYFILRKKTSVLMTGWIIDDQTHAFLVTDEDKGAWKKSNVSRSQLRCINIGFHSFEETPVVPPPPTTAPSPAVATARSIATAPGPKVQGSYRHIKGKVGDLIESLNILYDRPGK